MTHRNPLPVEFSEVLTTHPTAQSTTQGTTQSTTHLIKKKNNKKIKTGAGGQRAHTHVHTHTRPRAPRRCCVLTAASSPLRGNCRQHRPWSICRPSSGYSSMANCGQTCKKVAKSLVDWWKMPTFAAMKKRSTYVITGVNVLTRQRDELSGPMDEDSARVRLEREIANRRYQRYQPYIKLRVERRLPVQLTIKFQDHEYK